MIKIIHKILCYFNTISYLKPIQIIYRPVFQIIRKFASINYPKQLVYESYNLKLQLTSKIRCQIPIKLQSKEITCYFNLIPWQNKDENLYNTCKILHSKSLSNDFLFSSKYEEAKVLPTFHQANKIEHNLSKIERYYLNYFTFLHQNNLSLEEKLYLIFDWISKNYDEHTEPWEPYVVSKRIQNIISWLLPIYNQNNFTTNYNNNYYNSTLLDSFITTIEKFIYFQVKRLILDKEHHLQGNHLLENLLSIVMGCVYLLFYSNYFNKNKAGITIYFRTVDNLQKHFNELQNILSSQILPDGAHEERTPLYQIEILKGLNILKNLIENLHLKKPENNKNLQYLKNLLVCYEPKLNVTIEKMKNWLSYLIHPDNNIALFHDSYFIDDNYEEIKNLGINYKNQADEVYLHYSKFFVKKWNDNSYFVADLSEPSPSHQPGHSHCSALSYELSIDGKRIIVDTGVGSYTNNKTRFYCRSSYAHNIPILENSEQSEIWGAFRIAKRSKVYLHNYLSDDQKKCSTLLLHLRDYNENLYLRIYNLYHNSKIEIEDKLIFRSNHFEKSKFVSFIHLAPNVKLCKLNDNLLQIAFSNTDFNSNIQTSNLPTPLQESKLKQIFIEIKNKFEISNCHIYYYLGKPLLSQVVKIYENNQNNIKYTIFWN